MRIDPITQLILTWNLYPEERPYLARMGVMCLALLLLLGQLFGDGLLRLVRLLYG